MPWQRQQATMEREKLTFAWYVSSRELYVMDVADFYSNMQIYRQMLNTSELPWSC